MTGSSFSLSYGLAPKVDPQADPAVLAGIGNKVRRQLAANSAAIDRGGGKADLFVLPGFLSRRECKRLVRVIERRIGPSPLFHGTEVDGFRTSSTHYFERDDAETLELEQRIDSLLGIDHRFAEVTQGQRYLAGQQFKHHYDYFSTDQAYWQQEKRRGGQRTWTAMVYLNEPEGGGATDFPELGLGVAPEAGTLLTWNNMDREGRPNPATLHAGTPVTAGVKYVITQWYRQDEWSLHLR
jgi:prolyl 4-hydroxylase